MTPSVASQLVKEFPREQIEQQIQAFDRRQLKGATFQNPAGYLVKSIREGYSSPRDAAAQKTVSPTRPRAVVNVAPDEKKDPVLNEVNAYLRSLTKDELAWLEAEALKRAPSVIADGYYRSKTAGGIAHEKYQSMLLEREARRIIQARSLKKAS